jgi:O-antigen/teichoic acid export membrane protein
MRNLETAFGATEKRTIFRRFGINALSYGYAQIVTLVVQFVQVPVFLHYWGSPRYGEWLVLTGIPLLLALLDLGVTQTTANRATISASAGNWSATRCSLQTAFFFILSLGTIIVIVSVVAAYFVDWRALLNLTHISGQEAQIIVVSMALYLVAQIQGGVIDAWFRAMDRTSLGVFLLANRRLIDVIVTTLVLVLGGGVAQIAVAMAMSQFILAAGLTIVVRRFSPSLALGISHASWSEFKIIAKPAFAYASFPLSQALTLQGGLQLLNQLSDASVVVRYTMARTFVRLIIQIGIVANSALKPEISRLAGRGDLMVARKFTLKVAKKIILLCALLYLLFIYMGPYVIQEWGRGKVVVDSVDLAMIGLHAVLNAVWFVPAALFVATNRHVGIALTYAGTSILSMMLWLCFRSEIEPMQGAALLLALPEFAMTVLFYFKICGKKND